MLILEIYESLPILLPISLMYYCAIDTFTPNKKHSSIYGWLYAEFLEHIILPLTLILTILIFPAIFFLLFTLLIYYFYGHILGEIKSFRDAVSIVTLIISLIILSFYPDIILFLNAITNQGLLIIVITLISTTTPYFLHKILLFSKDGKLTNFLKGYAISIISTIIISIISVM